MGILGPIVPGLVIGAITKAIMPGNDPGGILIAMAIGILVAVVVPADG